MLCFLVYNIKIYLKSTAVKKHHVEIFAQRCYPVPHDISILDSKLHSVVCGKYNLCLF